MNRPRLHPWLRLAAAAALCLLPACLVTEKALEGRLQRLASDMGRSRSSERKTLEERLAALEKKEAELAKTLAALEVSFRAQRTELLAVKGNTDRLFEAARQVEAVRKEARAALEEAERLRRQSGRSAEALAKRVQDALAKYRSLLAEEKRLLAERIRFLNDALRRLEPPGEEEPGD